MSKFLKFFRNTILIFTSIALLQIISAPITHAAAAAITLQAAEGISDQLDATLARHYAKSYATGYSLEDRIRGMTNAQGVKPKEFGITTSVEGHINQAGMPTRSASALPPKSLPRVWGAVVNSDLIVVGTPIQSRGLPIEDHSFLFTEYTVKVEKVISPEHSNVLPGDVIIISRGGGQMMLDNVLITAEDTAFTEFLLNQSYVLMLQSIPETSTYQAYASRTYAIRNGRVFNISSIEGPTTPPKDLPSFLADVDTSLEHKRLAIEERKRAGEN